MPRAARVFFKYYITRYVDFRSLHPTRLRERRMHIPTTFRRSRKAW